TGAAMGTLSAPAIASALKNAGLDDTLTDGLTALASTAAGAATGGTQGGAAAFNEVVNNYLAHEQLAAAQTELVACDGDSSCMADVVERYQAISQEQNEAANAACSTDLAACQEHSLAAAEGEYARYADDTLWDLPNEALPYMQALFDENIGVQNAFGEATIARLLSEGGISPEMAAVLAGMPVGYNKGSSNRTSQIGASNTGRGVSEYELRNNPPANSHVKLNNGTEFRTGEGGYVDEVTFKPVNSSGVRDSRQTAVGKEGVAGDVGGHIQACRHGGTCDRFNLFPQNSNFNNSAYKRWENEITRSLQNGDEVGNVTVHLNRADPYNPRPDSVRVEYTINGEIKVRNFRNQAGG
ncbi:DNA/RNA non-specific endonuclease, partial [Vreelandella zhaodongensis]